ncbi:hypothetical protein QBC34DRAFT_298374, partial [Podospora aff. communis PSN243]
RAASLPDITQPVKRPRLDALPTFLPASRLDAPLAASSMARPEAAQDRPVHDRVVDDTYRRQALTELQEKSNQHTLPPNSHGKDTDNLIRKLLEKAK